MRVVAALLLATSTASAQPAPAPTANADPWTAPLPVGDPAPPPSEETSLTGCVPVYAEGHLLFGGRSGPNLVPEVGIVRYSLGLRFCTSSAANVYGGLVLDRGINTDNGHEIYSAFGAEGRVMFPLSGSRVGPHLAITRVTAQGVSSAAFWLGARVETKPVIVGFDVLRVPGDGSEGVSDVWGFYGSIGLYGGWPGVIGIGLVSALWIGNIFANEHGS